LRPIFAADFISFSNFGHAAGPKSRFATSRLIGLGFFALGLGDFVMNERTPVQGPPEEYFSALGHLISYYPAVEEALFATLGLLTDTPKPVGLALFGDFRVDALISAINKVLEARRSMPEMNAALDAEITAFLNFILPQISDINTVRNKIIHHGGLGTAELLPNVVISNKLRARPSNQYQFAITAKDLQIMLVDLILATLYLAEINMVLASSDARSPEVRADWPEKMKRPWQYKSPLKGKGSQPHQTPSQKPKGPPQSSGA
jgi:hypothetical protein